jgi:hypothetical protein
MTKKAVRSQELGHLQVIKYPAVSQPGGRLTASTQGFGRIDKLDGALFYFLDLPRIQLGIWATW